MLSFAHGSEIGKDDFLKMFEKFKADFNSKNISRLNDYIDPEFGLFVLDNPGVYINGYYFKSFDSIINSSKEADLYRMKNIELKCNPIKGNLPQYSCGGVIEGWDKEGCYYNNIPERNDTSGIYGFFDENSNSGSDSTGNFNEMHTILRARLNRNVEQFFLSYFNRNLYVTYNS